MHELFLGIPLNEPRIYHRCRGASIKRRNFITSGKFVAVKEYTYIKVAKRIGETQVGINLFYLLDNNNIIIGYRRDDIYFLREGAKKNVTKIQARKKKKPSQTER